MRVRSAILALAVAALATSSCSGAGPGAPAWEAELPGRFADAPLADGSAVICFASDDDSPSAPGTVTAFAPETGARLWSRPAAAPPQLLDEGAVWTRDPDLVLRAADERTGEERWSRPDVARLLDVADGRATVVGADGRVATLDAATGAVLRSVEVPGLADDTSSAAAGHGSGRVYLLAGGALSATDAATGATLWSVDVGTHTTELGVAGEAVVLNRSDAVEGYDGATGGRLWSRTVSYEVVPRRPALSGGVLYSSRLDENEYHPDGGFMRRYDASTGEKLGEVATVAFAGDDDVAIVDGVFLHPLGVRHYDPVSAFFVDLGYGWRWAESWDSKLVANDAATGAVRWSAGSWSWGFLTRPAIADDRAFTARNSAYDEAPARLFAYRVGGVSAP